MNKRKELFNILSFFDTDEIVLKRKAKKNYEVIKYGTDEFRGSKYRGVSKNRNFWQVTNLAEKNKMNIGSLPSE